MTHLSPAYLIGLAAQLEREGQYNAAKLLRAGADSLVWRESHKTALTADDRLPNAIRVIAKHLSGTSAAALAEPLLRSADATEGGRVPLDAETPDPFVCRLCGLVTIGSFDVRCPDCGAWPTTARRTRPIYWLRESNQTEAIELLRAAPLAVESIISGFDDAALATRPAPAEWSAGRVLQHLHDAQLLFRHRLDLLIPGGDPDLASARVWEMEQVDRGAWDTFAAYRDLRGELVEILETVDPAAWAHTGRHEEWGRVTLLEQTSYFANHEPTHLAQLADATPSRSGTE